VPSGARDVHDQRPPTQFRCRKAGDTVKHVTITILAGLALSACGGQPSPGSAGSAASAPSAKPTYFTVPAEQLSHLTIVPVRKASWSATLRTTGTVDWDNDHTTQAITQVSGPIVRIVVDLGARVKAG